MPQQEVISFKLDEHNKIHATLLPKSLIDDDVDFTSEFLLTQLAEVGLERCEIYEDVVRYLVNAYHSRDVEVSKVIGERKDCQILLEIDETTLLKAWISVKEAKGGFEPTRDLLRQKLEAADITFGIKEEVLEQIAREGFTPKTLLAEGIAPTKGKDAWFERLLEMHQDKGKAVAKEDGSVDYKNLNIVQSVEVGTPLLRKHLPTLGLPGRNIHGTVLPALAGQDKYFGKLKGAIIDSQDPNLIIAEEPGQPHIAFNSVTVHPIFSISSVDYSSGNIDFTGTVVVSGTVESGFKIKAGGNIIVSGTVEAAELEAKGYITLKAGIIGGGKAVIKAGGNIKAKFIESAKVESYKSIAVGEMIVHSDVTAAEKIIVGGERGKGQITGGVVRSTTLIEAKILGGSSGTKTLIEVGWNPYLYQKSLDLKARLEKQKTRLEEIIKSIVYLRTCHDDPDKQHKLAELEKERDVLSEELNTLEEHSKTLSEEMNKAEDARVVAREKVYPGTRVLISKVSKDIDDTFAGGASFYLKGREIIVGPG